MTTFQTVASEFYKAFTRNPRNVWTLVDDAPEWMRDAMREAHFDGRLPDDWIYEHARLIIGELEDRESPDSDATHEICDSLVDIYTSALTSWLASNANNVQVCNDARNEGLLDPALATQDCAKHVGIENWIAMGQYTALTYIAGALLHAIEAQADERAHPGESACERNSGDL